MIRPMTVEDIVHVQRIAYATWQATYENLIPENLKNIFLDRSYSNMMLLKRMEKTTLLILEHEDVPIGFINFTKTDNDGDAELISIHVLPAYQRQGFGKELFNVMKSVLTNTSQLFVYIDVRNITGRNFYEKEGFSLLSILSEHFEGLPVETAEYVYTFQNEN